MKLCIAVSDCPRIKWCNKYWCDVPPSTCTECDQHGGPEREYQAYWLDQNECKRKLLLHIFSSIFHLQCCNVLLEWCI